LGKNITQHDVQLNVSRMYWYNLSRIFWELMTKTNQELSANYRVLLSSKMHVDSCKLFM